LSGERPAIQPHDPVGLCRTCAFARLVPTARSTFWLCRRAATDPRYERYPRLPVRACPGWSAGGPGAPDPPAESGDRG
jgi:hypothetical protein